MEKKNNVFPLKELEKRRAELQAESIISKYKRTKRYAKDLKEFDRDFINFMIYGESPHYYNEAMLKEIKEDFLNLDIFIENYDLTEEEIKIVKGWK